MKLRSRARRNGILLGWAALVVGSAAGLGLHTRVSALVLLALLGLGAVVVVVLVTEIRDGRDEDAPVGSSEAPPEAPPRTLRSRTNLRAGRRPGRRSRS